MQRPRYEKLPDFAVRFMGYSADVIARKGNAIRFGRINSDLPLRIDKLETLAESATRTTDKARIEMRCGEGEISLNRGADIGAFLRQLTQRYRQIGPILEQAEKIGSGIRRPPYSDYIDEIARTGISCVVFYGDGLFVDGKLLYRPERQTFFVERTETERKFMVTPASIP